MRQSALAASRARTIKRSREMNSSDTLSLQGHRLLQIGVALFLFSSLEGFAVPHFAVPSLGRSVHTLSAFSGVILLTLGLLWPRLNLGAASSRIAFWLFIYSAFATLAGFMMAAVWGAGNSIIPLAAGTARGTDFQEAAINVVMYSGAPGISHFVGAHSLGPSNCAPSVRGRIAGARDVRTRPRLCLSQTSTHFSSQVSHNSRLG